MRDAISHYAAAFILVLGEILHGWKRGMQEEEVEGRILKYNFFCWGKAGDDLR